VVLDSDPSCIRTNQQNSIQFRYSIKCQFNDFDPSQDLDSHSEQIRNFDYFVLAKDYSFAISREANWTLIMKIFNFNQFTDLSASLYSPVLRPSQIATNNIATRNVQKNDFKTPKSQEAEILNKETPTHSILEIRAENNESGSQPQEKDQTSGSDVFFMVDIYSIPDRFYAGGRVYLEVGIDDYRQRIPGLVVNQRDRRFIDVYDYERPPAADTKMPQWQRALIVVAIIIAVICVIWFIYWYRQYLSSQQLIKDR